MQENSFISWTNAEIEGRNPVTVKIGLIFLARILQCDFCLAYLCVREMVGVSLLLLLYINSKEYISIELELNFFIIPRIQQF